MQFHDLVYHCHAQSVALGFMTCISLAELFENMSFYGFVHIFSVIGHGYCECFFLIQKSHLDRIPLLREFGGVIEEIRPYFFEQRGISAILSFRQIQLKVQFFLFPFLLCQKNTLPDLLINAEQLSAAQNRLAFNPVEQKDCL